METSQFSLPERLAQRLRVGNVRVPLRAAAVNFHGPDSPAHAACGGVRRSAAARRGAARASRCLDTASSTLGPRRPFVSKMASELCLNVPRTKPIEHL